MNLKSVVFLFIAIGNIGSLVVAQEPVDPREVLNKMAEARKKIEQYSVTCDVKGDPGDVPSYFLSGHKRTNESHVEIWIQNVSKELHILTAARDLKPGAKQARWKVGGISDSIEIRSNDRGTLTVRDMVRFGTVFKEREGYTENDLFDPLTIGMGFNSDFLMGRTFESQVESLLDWCKVPSSHATLTDGIVTWNYNFDTTIKFDTQRSYWPVSLRCREGGRLFQEVDVELGKFKEFDVPVRAVIKCSPPNKDTIKTEIEFKWENMNQPIEIGEKCVKLLEERFVDAK